jgi:DNA-damage-inducible protein D
MNNKSLKEENSIFKSIKHIDEEGQEFWYARELQKALDYIEWRKFKNVIKKAMIACKASNCNVSERFVKVDKTIKMPKGANKTIEDYKLSRYSCYLIVQNGDSKKKVIASGQTYFAVQTKK